MKVQPPGTCCDRWQDRASIRPPMHQRSSFCAQEARRLDATGQRGRAEARVRRHGRSLGTLVEESGWRLVWPEEGSSWPLRHVRASGDGSVGTGQGRAQSEEQPDASSLVDNRLRRCLGSTAPRTFLASVTVGGHYRKIFVMRYGWE